MTKEIYNLGEVPPLGEVPKKMHAQLIRPERFGEPTKAFQLEQVEVPSIKPDEVLVYTMAAGVNYNNVWAALGIPVNVIGARNKKGEPEQFHIGGSDWPNCCLGEYGSIAWNVSLLWKCKPE